MLHISFDIDWFTFYVVIDATKVRVGVDLDSMPLSSSKYSRTDYGAISLHFESTSRTVLQNRKQAFLCEASTPMESEILEPRVPTRGSFLFQGVLLLYWM